VVKHSVILHLLWALCPGKPDPPRRQSGLDLEGPRQRGGVRVSQVLCQRLDLKTDEDIQLYLDACIEEAGDDPAFIVDALGDRQRKKYESTRAWTENYGANAP